MRITLAHPLTACEAAEYMGAECTAYTDSMIYGVTTDSREVQKGDLFIAFRGESFDGNAYIGKAVKGGASAVLCEYCNEDLGAAVILADNTEKALGKLAKAYFSRYRKKVVAVTGSVGKTTTKEFISAVLSEKFSVHRADGNFNNEIGLPMTLLATPDEADICVFELGMDARGDIEYLSDIVRPDIAVVTMIGSSHLERLGTRENICEAKMEIVSGMKKGAPIILNGDEPLLRQEKFKKYYPLFASVSGNGDFCAKNIITQSDCTEFEISANSDTHKMKISAVGAHLVWGALYAFAVGYTLGMQADEIRRGLLAFRGVKMRQAIYDVGDITLIDDCYNAAPESMRAAADVLSSIGKNRAARTVALLGDMLELGDTSRELHSGVGEYMAKSGISLLFTLGEGAKEYAEGAKKGGLSENCIYSVVSKDDYEECAEIILQKIRKGDILLVKASRSIGAERVIKYLSEHINKRT